MVEHKVIPATEVANPPAQAAGALQSRCRAKTAKGSQCTKKAVAETKSGEPRCSQHS